MYNLIRAQAVELSNQYKNDLELAYHLGVFIEQLYNETLDFYLDELPNGTAKDLFRQVCFGWSTEPYISIAKTYINDIQWEKDRETTIHA